MSEIWERVAADLRSRHEAGVREYGMSLRESGADHLQHAYEEALDLACYLRAELDRRKP